MRRAIISYFGVETGVRHVEVSREYRVRSRGVSTDGRMSSDHYTRREYVLDLERDIRHEVANVLREELDARLSTLDTIITSIHSPPDPDSLPFRSEVSLSISRRVC